MTDKPSPVQEFLLKIGPRALTDEEARELHLLRIRLGLSESNYGVIKKILKETPKDKGSS